MTGFDFHGAVVPIITPLTVDDDIDVPSLKRHVRFVVDAGVNGIWALGAVGQFQGLTERQRDLVTDTVIEEVAGRVPVLVGCIDTSADRCGERARRSAAAGADAVFATAPFYDQVTQTEVLAHFRRIRQRIDLPLVAYDAQYATQTPLSIGTIRTLAEEGTLAGIKDSADFSNFRRLVVELSDLPSFSIMTGHTSLMDVALLLGAKGCVGTLANLVPRTYAAIYGAALNGEWERARSYQDEAVQVNQLIDMWGPGSVFGNFFGAVKLALQLMGVIDSANPGRPYPPASPAQVERITAGVARLGLKGQLMQKQVS